VEEGTRIGGFGSAVTDLLVEEMGSALPPLMRIGLPDEFPNKYGVQDDLFEVYGLMPNQIAATVADRARTQRVA
jgi:transketolase